MTVENEAAHFTDVLGQRALQNVYGSIQNLIRLRAMCATKSDIKGTKLRDFEQHVSRNVYRGIQNLI